MCNPADVQSLIAEISNHQKFLHLQHRALPSGFRLKVVSCTLFILPVLHNSTLPLTSVLEFHEHSKKEEACEFLQSIRNMNPDGDIVIVLDNFRSHHANGTREFAEANRIQLVFSPPYSPDLNPIEFIWKGLEE